MVKTEQNEVDFEVDIERNETDFEVKIEKKEVAFYGCDFIDGSGDDYDEFHGFDKYTDTSEEEYKAIISINKCIRYFFVISN